MGGVYPENRDRLRQVNVRFGLLRNENPGTDSSELASGFVMFLSQKTVTLADTFHLQALTGFH